MGTIVEAVTLSDRLVELSDEVRKLEIRLEAYECLQRTTQKVVEEDLVEYRRIQAHRTACRLTVCKLCDGLAELEAV